MDSVTKYVDFEQLQAIIKAADNQQAQLGQKIASFGDESYTMREPDLRDYDQPADQPGVSVIDDASDEEMDPSLRPFTEQLKKVNPRGKGKSKNRKLEPIDESDVDPASEDWTKGDVEAFLERFVQTIRAKSFTEDMPLPTSQDAKERAIAQFGETPEHIAVITEFFDAAERMEELFNQAVTLTETPPPKKPRKPKLPTTDTATNPVSELEPTPNL